jgi:hypothetical protein
VADEKANRLQPPEPPEIEREIRLNRVQKLGIPVILAIPLLALLGLFGTRMVTATAGDAEMALMVHYATRSRYQQQHTLAVQLDNRSDRVLETVTIRFDRDYISRFAPATFTPQVDTITAEAYIVQLEAIHPGETRLIVVELKGEHYGLHRGSVTAAAGNHTPLQVELQTFIFP